MKKTISLLLSAIILASAASCSSSNVGPEIKGNTLSDAATSENPNENLEPIIPAPSEGAGIGISIGISEDSVEQILYEGAELIITALGIERFENGEGIRLRIENLGDRDISFGCGYDGETYVSANGYALKYTDFITVGAGGTEETSIAFTDSLLSLYGIADIEMMELGFTVEDENGAYHIAPVTYATIGSTDENFYVNGYQAAILNPFVQSSNGIELHMIETAIPIANSGINILSQAITVGENGHRTLNLELENTTDTLAYVGFDEWKINDVKLSEYAGNLDICPAGKRIVLSYDIDTMFGDVPLEFIGIDDIANIKMDFTVGADNDNDSIIDSEGAETVNVGINVSGAENAVNMDGNVIYDGQLISVISKAVVDIKSSDSYTLGTAYLVNNKTAFPLSIYPTELKVLINGKETVCYTEGCSIEGGETGAIVLLFSDAQLESADVNDISISFSVGNDDGTGIDLGLMKVTY